MLKVENYTKENLEECISFLSKEIYRVKVEMNKSGFIKYSPMGMIMINYRRELKRLCKSMMDDLKEDFNTTYFTKSENNIDDKRRELKQLRNSMSDTLKKDYNAIHIIKSENNNDVKPMLFVGECKLLKKGDVVFVWDGDMSYTLSRVFVRHGNEGGVIVNTPDGYEKHYWNYSTIEPSKEVLDFMYKHGTTVIGTDKDK